MKKPGFQSTLVAVFVTALLATSVSVQAKEKTTGKSPEVKAAKASKKTHKVSGGKITLIPHSGENFAQRSSRLKRECKGRVNAGACEGYTN